MVEPFKSYCGNRQKKKITDTTENNTFRKILFWAVKNKITDAAKNNIFGKSFHADNNNNDNDNNMLLTVTMENNNSSN